MKKLFPVLFFVFRRPLSMIKIFAKTANRYKCFTAFSKDDACYDPIKRSALRSICQKEPPEVFCNKICSLKFCKIHRKTPEACSFIKKEALTQVFFYEFCKISKNTFSTEHLWVATSAMRILQQWKFLQIYLYKKSFKIKTN